MAARRMDEGLRQRLDGFLAALEGVGAEVLHGAANVGCRGACGKLRAKRHANRVGNLAGEFPKEAAACKAKNRAPDAVEVHRNNRSVDAFHDALHTAAEGKELADTRELAFGEDADEFAILQC